MNPFFGRSFIVPVLFIWCICCTAVQYSTQLSLSKSGPPNQYYDNSQTANQSAKSSHQQDNFFNLTYGSRLLYLVLRDQVNSLQQQQVPEHQHSTNTEVILQSCSQALRSLLNEPTQHRWSLSSEFLQGKF